MREVPTSEGEAFALAHDMLFIETSAKILCNVDEAFSLIAREIYNRLHEGSIRQKSDWEGVKKLPSRPPNIYFSEETNDTEQKRKCCH